MSDLDAFLKGDAAPLPDAAPNPAPAEAPPAEAAPPAEPKPAEPKPDAPKPDADPDEPPLPEGQQVPVSALQAERAQRRDWKEKALRAEGEMAELRRQIEEFRKAPPPQAAPQAQPVPQQQVPMPNPVEDPVGYGQWLADRVSAVSTAKAIEEANLAASEYRAREKHGQESVKEATDWFLKNAVGTPLQAQMRAAPDPWGALMEHYKAVKLAAEVGNDPDGYEAKVEARVLARLEAAKATPAAPQTPVTLPRSLAGATAAAARTNAPLITEDVPLGQLFPQR